MSNEGGAEMPSRHTSPAAGPLDVDDLLAEILLRLPAKPSSLPRASLVCKRWRSIATAAAFRRRFRTHHRKPPILGVFEVCATELKFMPLLDPPDCIPSECFSLDLRADGVWAWNLLGCRHGRVLLINRAALVLLVFEPVSGDTLRIDIPPVFVRDGFTTANGVVLCAAGDDQDHVHGDCHSSPFKVVLVDARSYGDRAMACVFSSQTSIWGVVAWTAEPCTGYVSYFPCTLIGAALYWSLYGTMDTAEDGILKFDLDDQSLTLISSPPVLRSLVGSQSWIIRAEDGGLGVAILSYPSFQLWHRKVNCHGLAAWMLWKTINMHEMLGPKANSAYMVGYSEDADAILMYWIHRDSHISDPIIVQLESMTVKKCHGVFYRKKAYHPFTNFYTTGTARA